MDGVKCMSGKNELSSIHKQVDNHQQVSSVLKFLVLVQTYQPRRLPSG
jgi:hypothetical protein